MFSVMFECLCNAQRGVYTFGAVAATLALCKHT